MATYTVKLRYTYRLRPSKTAKAQLHQQFDACRWVWNKCVEVSKARHGAGLTSGPAELDKMLTKWRARNDWLGEQPSVSQQQTIRDFARARSKCLKDWQAKKHTTGYPRFKSRHRALPSMSYTLGRFSLPTVDGRTRLRVAGGVIVPVVWSRELPSPPTSVRVYQDALGHWYGSFVVEVDVEHLPNTGKVCGIDWGVTTIATATTAEHDLAHPQHRRSAQPKLTRYQRQMARRKPLPGQQSSAGYKAAKRRVAKLHKKVSDQRTDDARKWAKKIVRDHDAIAVEDFRPKFLARTTMAEKSGDAAIATAKMSLEAMAKKHGRTLVLVDPAYTTMDCSICGARAKHRLDLSVRVYDCASCGVSLDRDRNAAANMVARAGLNPACADGVSPGFGHASRAWNPPALAVGRMSIAKEAAQGFVTPITFW